MDNKSKKLNKSEDGFIQIPILIAFLILGAVATSGGYYAVQHNKKPEVVKVMEGDIVSDREIKSEEQSVLNATDPAFSGLKISEVSGVKWNDTLSKKAEKLISQLTTIKEMVDGLNKAESEVKTKIVGTETGISDLRIEKLGKLATSSTIEVIKKTYEELIAIEDVRKKNLQLTLGSSLMDTLFYSMEIDSAIKSLKNGEFEDGLPGAQKLVDIHDAHFSALKEQSVLAVETVIAENKAYAQEFLLRMNSTGAIADRYALTLQALEEIEQARKDIEKVTTSISYENYFVPSSQIITSIQTSTSGFSCKFPTSKYLLVPGKGWAAVRQCDNGTYIEADKYVTDTSNMTTQQVCDMKKAAQLSGGAYIGDSQPDPACQ